MRIILEKMWYWLKFIVLFFAACFFLLPALNVEDPFRSLALRFFNKETEAVIYNHSCNPDRIYLYRYQIQNKTFEQRYNGYIEALDNIIPENERCQEVVNSQPKFLIKYFPLFAFWSEPTTAERNNLLMFIGINIVKFFSIILLIWTFLR